MRDMLRTFVVLVAVVAMFAALGLAAGCAAEEEPVVSDEPSQEEPAVELAEEPAGETISGEEIVEGACAQCHDSSRIFTQSYAADWSAIVEEMNTAHGAELTEEEQAAVVAFLGSRELSAGEQVVAEKCSECHDATRINEQVGAADWAAVVQEMTDVHGAQLTDEEKAVAVEFLEGL